jgi:hypothetical protein
MDILIKLNVNNNIEQIIVEGKTPIQKYEKIK